MNIAKTHTTKTILYATMLSIVVAILYTPCVSAQTHTAIGKIIATSGSVYARKADNTTRSLKRGSDLFLNETLQTGKKGYVQVRFLDNTLLALKPNTAFRTNTYRRGIQKNTQANYNATLLKGGFKILTGLIAEHNPDHFKVNSRVATITVRGTTFLGYYNSITQALSAGVLQGAIALQRCPLGGAPNAAGLCRCPQGPKYQQQKCPPTVLPVSPSNGQAGYAQATMTELTQLSAPPPELTTGYHSDTAVSSSNESTPSLPGTEDLSAPASTTATESINTVTQTQQVNDESEAIGGG